MTGMPPKTLKLTVLPQLWHERPRTRGDCEDAARPCPWVSCRHHLWLEMGTQGRQRSQYPHRFGSTRELPEHLDPADMVNSCSLDVADGSPLSLEEVGAVLGGISREAVRQMEEKAIRSYRRQALRMKSEDDGATEPPIWDVLTRR